jgi:hypothetical protein
MPTSTPTSPATSPPRRPTDNTAPPNVKQERIAARRAARPAPQAGDGPAASLASAFSAAARALNPS